MNHDLMKFRGTPMFCKAEMDGENVVVNLTTDRKLDNIKIGDTIEWRDKNSTPIVQVLDIIEEREAKVSSSYKGVPLTFLRVKGAFVSERNRD